MSPCDGNIVIHGGKVKREGPASCVGTGCVRSYVLAHARGEDPGAATAGR